MISLTVGVVSPELNSSPSLVDMLQFPQGSFVQIILLDEFGSILTLDALRNSFLGCVISQAPVKTPT